VRDVTGGFHRVATRKAGTVLVANSDPELLHILEVNLLHANLDVVPARSGAEALGRAAAVHPDIVILDTALPDLDIGEVCRRLKESPQNSLVPVIAIGARGRRKGRARAVYDANHYIAKPFYPHEVVAVVLAFLRQKERAENIDPFTGLANQTQVNRELAGLIEQSKTFAAMYISMDDLKAFNRVYGFAQGDRTIRLLGNIISEAVRLFGNPEDLVAHLSGDKFVVISTPYKARNLCRRIIADFNRRIKSLYAGEHLKRGYIAYESPGGAEEQSPIMSLRIAVVTNQKRTFYHYLEVSEAAAEQTEYMRQLPGNICYFDLPVRHIEPVAAATGRLAAHVHQEEMKTIKGVLAWLDFLVNELSTPLGDLRKLLETTERRGNGLRRPDILKEISETVSRMERAVEAISSLNWAERLADGASFEEVDIGETLDWIVRQVNDVSERRHIGIIIAGTEGIGRFLADRKSLTQALLYVARAELATAPPESKLHINAVEINDDFIIVTFFNPEHHISQRALAALLQGQLEDFRGSPAGNELYLARLLLQGIGGKLNVSSEMEKGTIYTMTIPRRWQSQMQEVNALKLAAEISRREAWAELRKMQDELSLAGEGTAAARDSLEKLRGKVQELGVLCNRSLFLTDGLGSQLEIQQEQLLQREEEQLSTTEALLNVCREIARSMRVGTVFDAGSAERVVNYALTIANEFNISIADRQALHHAALLKDLGLVLSPRDTVERRVTSSLEEAVALRVRFNQMWKELSTIPFLSQALVFVVHRYERWDGTGGPLGIGGDRIPLGARILAVADSFDAAMMAADQDHQQAVQQVINGSGLWFDPDVVGAFLRAWRMKKLEAVPGESARSLEPQPGEVKRKNSG
jgi:diguanylate cyclase (GGDEF)-like protein